MRMDLSIAPAGVAARRVVSSAGLPSAPPAYALDRIVIEGDSITSGMPSTPNGFYSYQYHDSRPDKFVEVRAQGSRVVGYAPNYALDDNGNSLLSNVAEDMAYMPDLVTVMIGANDLASARTGAQYRGDLIAYHDAVKAARPGCRVAWSPPQPWDASDQSHPNYATFTARRAEIVADCRDPAVWGQWCEYFLPMGLHPDFIDPAILETLFNNGDSVHPNAAGHARFYASFKPAIDSIGDQGRATSTAPYGSVWPGDETNLAPGAEITRRFVVSGIHHAGLALGVSVTGGGAQVRLNGGGWLSAVGTSVGNGHRIYNGDVIDLKLTTSAANDTPTAIGLTIGSETRTIIYRTVAAVAPASYAHGGMLLDPNPAMIKTFAAVDFAQSGLAVFGITRRTTADIIGVTVGGVAAARVYTQSTGTARAIEVWTCPVTAGTRDVVIINPASRARHVATYGVMTSADPTPTQIVGSAPASQSQPHLTPALTVPANGLALAWLFEEGAAPIAPATCNAPTERIAEGNAVYQSGAEGLALARRTTSGQASFNFAFGTWPRLAVVFKAAGT